MHVILAVEPPDWSSDATLAAAQDGSLTDSFWLSQELCTLHRVF